MREFDLKSNPFHILNASVRNTRDEIADCYEDALSDGEQDEHALLQAHQSLIGPKTRLEAELTWLPELSPLRARQLVDTLASSSDGQELVATLSELEGLSGANCMATLCTQIPGQGQVVEQLIACHRNITPEYATEIISDLRAISGFPSVDLSLVADILPRVRQAHAQAVIYSITQATHPGNLMTEIVENDLASEARASTFMDEVAKHYDNWSAPTLRKIKDRIDDSVQLIRDNAEDKEAIGEIVTLLVEWDEYSQPCQLMDESKGHDEARSKAIYDELRSLCLLLAKDGRPGAPGRVAARNPVDGVASRSR